MYENVKQNLFEIRIDDTGITYIRRIVRLIGVVWILIILEALAISIVQVSDLLKDYQHDDLDGLVWFNVKFMPWFTFGIVIGNAVCVYYYLHFLRTLDRSINTNDQALFNQSFKYVYRNIVILICVVSVSFILNGLVLIVVFDLL